MPEQLKPGVSPSDHTRGARNPQLEIVEYGDFQCLYCGAAEPIVEEILEQFGTAVSVTFRNFPLRDTHPEAYHAALAAEAAAKQGKYWEMHDRIFAIQDTLNAQHLIQIASDLGLDMTRFRNDQQSPEVLQKIENDFESGARSGVNGTPTFFVDGIRFDGAATDLYVMISENAS
jgi:protein-disulfide isomerase